MTIRDSLQTKIRSTIGAPPLLLRILGGTILAYDAYSWIGESAPTTLLELIKHGMMLLIGLICAYPEGAARFVGVAVRLIPGRKDA